MGSSIIYRREYPQIPPKVAYRLTGKGRSLLPIPADTCRWSEVHRPPH